MEIGIGLSGSLTFSTQRLIRDKKLREKHKCTIWMDLKRYLQVVNWKLGIPDYENFLKAARGITGGLSR